LSNYIDISDNGWQILKQVLKDTEIIKYTWHRVF